MSRRDSSPAPRKSWRRFPEVEFKIFDLEKPAVEQEFEAEHVRFHHWHQRAARR